MSAPAVRYSRHSSARPAQQAAMVNNVTGQDVTGVDLRLRQP
jgi:hypothetical protein